jgi:hypothetical protein
MKTDYRPGRFFCIVCTFAFLQIVFLHLPLLADEQSYYKVARECAEWALPESGYFKFIDYLMAESIKEQVATHPRLRSYSKAVMEIYQQGTRDFLTELKALDTTWDKAARRLMSEFSESELVTLRDYQNEKIGNEFLNTETGRKWQEKAEDIIRSSVDDVRRSLFFNHSESDLYPKTIQKRSDLYEAQGKIPPGLLQSYPPPVALKPVDSDEPLFKIFAGIPLDADKPRFTIESETPLLVVSTLNDLVLAQDNKGVLICLNDADTKIFSELTRKFRGKILFLVCTDTVMEGMRITAPIEDGYIEFKYPGSAAVTEYLRRRFRIGEFK